MTPFCPARLGDFFCLERLGDIFVSRDRVIFLVLRGWVIVFPERLGDFFLSQEVG